MIEEGSDILHDSDIPHGSNTPHPSGTSSFACRLPAAAGSKMPQQHQHCPAAHHHILFSSQVQSWDWVLEHSSDLSFELHFLKAWVVLADTHCAAVGTVVAEERAPWAWNLQLQGSQLRLLRTAAAVAADASFQEAS